jgi:hypothetical protein
VIVQFMADTLFKTLVVVPVVGGLVLVALVAGDEDGGLVAGASFGAFGFDDLAQMISAMVGVLLAHPIALAAFLTALGVILAGGSVLMFAVKAGSVTVLLAGDRTAGAIEEPPLRMSALRQANQASFERFIGGVRHLFPRYLRLGIALTVVYGLIAGAYLFFLFGPPIADALNGPVTTTLASLTVIVVITLVNFLYLLLQVVIAAEDCSVVEAVPHVARLIRRRSKALAQVLAAILSLMLMATGASILATTALSLIAFVPFVGLATLLLQVIAWLVRGVVFQFIGLTGVATYLRLHYALQPSGVRVPDGLLTRT